MRPGTRNVAATLPLVETLTTSCSIGGDREPARQEKTLEMQENNAATLAHIQEKRDGFCECENASCQRKEHSLGWSDKPLDVRLRVGVWQW